MQLSPKAIEDFKKIYREDYGVELTDSEALALAVSFFNLMRVICRPLPTENCNDTADVLY
jgi:hypothetical protein